MRIVSDSDYLGFNVEDVCEQNDIKNAGFVFFIEDGVYIVI
ncbi:hypothetical protein AWH56_26720 [Anaerobacillus isosaccharinicus]|uniref:Uncharacterized protein n=1 Tax=Anaerobacillus isosaccharinicus TaxID=1532552 RepID=A0AC62A4Q3_9BACI|nr:hypothetical protein [Anaerobacillus isosaccharinicus]